uniref:DENN domain containing 2B n=1 Tax=Cyprinus carpio TaxID=7962 RepID=A0A8C1R0L9_CYPCA
MTFPFNLKSSEITLFCTKNNLLEGFLLFLLIYSCFRCQSVSPPPILTTGKESCSSHLSGSEDVSQQGRYAKADAKLWTQKNWSCKTASLRSGASLSTDFECQSRLTKSRSISCLDKRLTNQNPPSGNNQDQKENQPQQAPTVGDGLNPGPFCWSTLSVGPTNKLGHKRTLSLSHTGTCISSVAIRKKISEWEGRKAALPRMSLCLEKRPGGGSEGCPSLLSSPCSEKTFDFKGVRRMSTAFSECSYPEIEEDGQVSDREAPVRFQKRPSKTESSGIFLRTLSARKETSAVLSRIQKIEQALKESPSSSPPQYLSNCYGLDKSRQKSFIISGTEDLDSTCGSKRSSICSVATEPEAFPGSERLSKIKQRFSISSTRSESPEFSSAQDSPGITVNPLPKPKRTFEYDSNRNHRGLLPGNGLPPTTESPPPLPSTPAPAIMRNSKTDESFFSLSHSLLKKTCYLLFSLASALLQTEKENPYEDVDPVRRCLARNSRLLPERSRDSLNRMLTSQDRKSITPPQLPSKQSSQSLRLQGPADRKSQRTSRLSKRHSHDDMLLLPQLGMPSSSCGLLDDSLNPSTDTLASHRQKRVPKVVQRINSIYCTKRGKKRLKNLSLSNIETASLRDDNSESESDSDDRFKAHTQRLLKLQSMLRRAPSYRTLELQLIEWQERELFEYFVVVSLKKKPTKNSYTPEVTYQFPKLERLTKQMREAEQRLKAIPQFCFPDAKDWSPVSEYNSETFSFMLTGEDGSRRFGYCRRLLPSGKGPRLPEVYCVISRLGCFNLFSKILDEVERRRGISAALVYPFMRSVMESPFPAPGKTIKVKTFLPGAGNEVIELRRPMDSRLEHVDFESLFSCLSVRQVVRVFASLLLERRVIFVADKLSTLSSCVHAVVALLYPFSWQHTFIPVLPTSMVDIVCCPTPFLVGILSSSLPKLKELPVEETLMVDLGTDRFIRQMDDEASLLPRKLQAALEQSLEQRNDIINQDSDSESDEECITSLNSVVSEAFIRFFLETIGHYSLFLTQSERGERIFQREAFRKSVASKSIRRFLGVFMESQMFAGFIQDREMRKCRAKGLFEQRVEQYLEELPDTEQSGVNKFLKGLGNKMKFLHKKN